MPVCHKPAGPAPSLGGPIKCSVCLEDARNPKRLPCNHAFCRPCVRHQISRLTEHMKRQEQITIICPYCRDYFVSSLQMPTRKEKFVNRSPSPELVRSKTSLGHVTEYGAHYSGDRKAERCQPCAEGSTYELARFWCHSCSEYMCSVCARYHQSMKMSKSHVVKTIRDKERYGGIKSKVQQTIRCQTAKVRREPAENVSRPLTRDYKCEPCFQDKKNNYAKKFCENCKEQMCDGCAKCHRSMKMSKNHKMLTIKELLARSDAGVSKTDTCTLHHGYPQSLFCKRCQTSCCTICAVAHHGKCGNTTKADKKKGDQEKSEIVQVTALKDGKAVNVSWGRQSKGQGHGDEKTMSFSIRPVPKTLQAPAIPKNRMEVRKRRIGVQTQKPKDWVSALAVLTSGDILLIQLYEPVLKMINPGGQVISTCEFYGDPWSVDVYNDSLAVVSFSDRKQLQLVHITRSGLEIGKKFATRHKCLAVCFAGNMIVASCWEGCIHAMTVAGEEICSIDCDHRGNRLFTNPEYIAADRSGSTVYVTDYKRNTVTALTILPSRIVNKPVFVFTDKDLQGPKGVAVDANDAIYVSGMASRNIFRLSPSGDIVQVYRRREDIDYYEAIAVTAECDRILVSAYEDNTIIEYKLTK